MRGFAGPVIMAGIVGGVAGMVALAFASIAVGDWPLAAVNATAHWLRGPSAAGVETLTLAETGVGLFTHFAAAAFWGAVLVVFLRMTGIGGPWGLVLSGFGTGLAAAILDYGILPRSMSPGWHLVLPPWGVALGFAALGLGLGLGVWLWRRR